MVVGRDSSMWYSIFLKSAMGKMWGESVPVVAALTYSMICIKTDFI